MKQMLSDMKIFKQLLRKSLNLIQGMEMMNQVLHLSMIPSKRIVGDPMHLMQRASVHKRKACALNFSIPRDICKRLEDLDLGVEMV